MKYFCSPPMARSPLPMQTGARRDALLDDPSMRAVGAMWTKGKDKHWNQPNQVQIQLQSTICQTGSLWTSCSTYLGHILSSIKWTYHHSLHKAAVRTKGNRVIKVPGPLPGAQQELKRGGSCSLCGKVKGTHTPKGKGRTQVLLSF